MIHGESLFDLFIMSYSPLLVQVYLLCFILYWWMRW